MKTKTVIILIGIVTAGFLASCNKKSTTPDDTLGQITGTYEGTLSTTGSLKSLTHDPTATTDITAVSDDEIQVHCYAEGFDTTIVLNFYENHDSVMVCMTGEDFEREYGHMNGHMGHDMHMGGTDWEHHMEDEHNGNDQHYGMFSMRDHSFEYAFKMEQGDLVWYKVFKGYKKQVR